MHNSPIRTTLLAAALLAGWATTIAAKPPSCRCQPVTDVKTTACESTTTCGAKAAGPCCCEGTTCPVATVWHCLFRAFAGGESCGTGECAKTTCGKTACGTETACCKGACAKATCCKESACKCECAKTTCCKAACCKCECAKTTCCKAACCKCAKTTCCKETSCKCEGAKGTCCKETACKCDCAKTTCCATACKCECAKQSCCKATACKCESAKQTCVKTTACKCESAKQTCWKVTACKCACAKECGKGGACKCECADGQCCKGACAKTGACKCECGTACGKGTCCKETCSKGCQPCAAAAELTDEELAEQTLVIAEECARRGEHEAARQFYKQAHLFAPCSAAGRKAIDRLSRPVEEATDAEADGPSACRPCTGVACPQPLTSAECYLRQLHHAQEMFRIAERCRRNGDLDMAYSCYHETRHVCPDSEYARQAETFLRRIELLRQLESTSEVGRQIAAQHGGQPAPFFVPVIFPASAKWACEAECQGAGSLVILTDGICDKPCAGHKCEGDAGELQLIRFLTGDEGDEDRPGDLPEGEDLEAVVPEFEHPLPEVKTDDRPFLERACELLRQAGGDIDIDIDGRRKDCLRVQCGVHMGGLGLQVRCEGSSVTFTVPVRTSAK